MQVNSMGRVRFRWAMLCAVLAMCGVIGVWPDTAVAQPTTVSYQGELQKDGAPFDGNADFKFVIVAGGDSLWSNDGSSSGGSEPTNSVSINVADGIFSIHLGESPMVPLEANLLNESTGAALRVWVNTGDGIEQLTDQPIASSVFSLHSESADGAPADFHALGTMKSGASITVDGLNNEIRCSGSLEFHVDGNHGLRLETATTTPNVIGGAAANTVTASNGGFIGGGGNATFANTVSGEYGVIGGGELNTAGPGIFTTVGGGRGNRASGAHATIPGGNDNVASGDYSFAAGRNARCINTGAFVWADAVFALLASNGANSFVVRASGGTWFYSDAASSTGVTLPAGGGAWSPISDRNVKENFDFVDGCDVLDRLAGIPLQTWNYKTQDASVRHIGAMAQDFQAAFGVGEDDKHISTVDADGVALAAIQGLYELVKEQRELIDATHAELESLRNKIKRLESASVEIGPAALQR